MWRFFLVLQLVLCFPPVLASALLSVYLLLDLELAGACAAAFLPALYSFALWRYLKYRRRVSSRDFLSDQDYH